MVSTRLSTKDACEYIITVRDTFQDNCEIYDTFLNVMKDFHAKRIGRTDVRSKVKELFTGHQELILGFNKFLPECYKITFKNDHTPLQTPMFEKALNFVHKVKAKLNNDRAYKSFLEILKIYVNDEKSITEVYHEVFNVLLRDHRDLRVEFAYFLPRYK